MKLLFLVHIFISLNVFAKVLNDRPQDQFERANSAVVRNKTYYKSGRFETTVTAGVMPYDSLVNHFMLGGRATWHLSDYYGWEIVDLQSVFPTVTQYAKDTVSSQGISNLQTFKMRYVLTSSFVFSPFYGKIRFLGSNLLFFDVYATFGGGVAKTETLRLSSSGQGITASEAILESGHAPAINMGIGLKMFLNRAMGVVIDMRNYVVIAKAYGSTRAKSNFSVFAGVSFYLPVF